MFIEFVTLFNLKVILTDLKFDFGKYGNIIQPA